MEGWILLPLRLVVAALIAVCVWNSWLLTQPILSTRIGSVERTGRAAEEQPDLEPPAYHWVSCVVAGISAIAVCLLICQTKRNSARRHDAIATRIHELGGAYVRQIPADRTPFLAALRAAYRLLLGSNKRFVNIDLSDTALSDDDLWLLRELPDLVSLNLSHTGISAGFVAEIAGLRKLQHLSLANTEIDDDACTHIAKLSKLRRLDLTKTRISDKGLQKLKCLRCLGVLEVAGTAVSEESRMSWALSQ